MTLSYLSCFWWYNHTDGGSNLALVGGVAGGVLVLIIFLVLCIIIAIFLKKLPKKTTHVMSGKYTTIISRLCTYGPYQLL